MKFINMKRVSLAVVALLIAGTTAAQAVSIPDYVYMTGTDGVTRVIEIDGGRITDVIIMDSYEGALANPDCEDAPCLNDDAFDGFGYGWISNDKLNEDASYSEGSWDAASNSFSYTSLGATVHISMTENYIEFTISKPSTPGLWFDGELGSDEDTTWVNTDALYSWDTYGDGDPILRWESNGVIDDTLNGSDYVGFRGSNSLTLRVYIYAHSNPDELDADTYMANFQEWVNENVTRTDIFTGVAQKAPVLTYGNPNSYADPTGELRALINQIKGLSGSLIGWK